MWFWTITKHLEKKNKSKTRSTASVLNYVSKKWGRMLTISWFDRLSTSDKLVFRIQLRSSAGCRTYGWNFQTKTKGEAVITHRSTSDRIPTCTAPWSHRSRSDKRHRQAELLSLLFLRLLLLGCALRLLQLQQTSHFQLELLPPGSDRRSASPSLPLHPLLL